MSPAMGVQPELSCGCAHLQLRCSSAHLHKARHGAILDKAVKHGLDEVGDPALQATQVHTPGLHMWVCERGERPAC